jgi:hypothetical protein
MASKCVIATHFHFHSHTRHITGPCVSTLNEIPLHKTPTLSVYIPPRDHGPERALTSSPTAFTKSAVTLSASQSPCDPYTPETSLADSNRCP